VAWLVEKISGRRAVVAEREAGVTKEPTSTSGIATARAHREYE
jgi:hypothetical protein